MSDEFVTADDRLEWTATGESDLKSVSIGQEQRDEHTDHDTPQPLPPFDLGGSGGCAPCRPGVGDPGPAVALLELGGQILVSAVRRPRMRYMGKASIWKSKALGRFVSMLGAFPVHRGTADRESLRTCLDVIENGESLVMFPEGAVPPPLKVPEMDENFQTAVPGQYLIGEVAGKPLVKNAANLGRAVVEHMLGNGMRAGALGGVPGAVDVAIVGAGVPVMGHIGLTPQSVHRLGGYHPRGKDAREAEALLRQAHALEQAGCFAVVLECVPASLAARITGELAIPTIGIGAGDATDAQAIKAAVARLEKTSSDYVARRMDTSIRKAMAGHKVEDFK